MCCMYDIKLPYCTLLNYCLPGDVCDREHGIKYVTAGKERYIRLISHSIIGNTKTNSEFSSTVILVSSLWLEKQMPSTCCSQRDQMWHDHVNATVSQPSTHIFTYPQKHMCLTYKRQQTNSNAHALFFTRHTPSNKKQERKITKIAQPCLCESKECRKCYKFMTLIMHFHSLCFRSHWCVSHYTWPLTPSHNTPLRLLLPVVGSVYSLLLLCCQCLSSCIYVMFTC